MPTQDSWEQNNEEMAGDQDIVVTELSEEKPEEDEPEALLNSLSALVFQFYELQKNLRHDVDKFSGASRDLSQDLKTVYQSLKGSVKDISMLAPELRRQIQDIIQSSVKETLKSNETALGKILVAAAAEPTTKLIESLDSSVRHAERTLDSYIGEASWSRWMYLGAGALSGLFVVLFFMLFLKAKPFTFVSEDDMRTYYNGIHMEKAWPHLSEKEKQRIDELANKPKAEKATK